MTGMEGTVVATAMPTIISQLGGFELFCWVFSGYFLAQGVTIPIYGRLADSYGRKRVLFFGLTVFLIGTTACGFAPNMLMLVIFRVVQGIGAGAVQPINQTLIGDLYRRRSAPRWRGSSPASGASPRSSARCSALSSSRRPPGTGCSGSPCRSRSSASCCSPSRCMKRIEHRAHRIDYLGAVLMASGIGLFLYALIQAHHLGLANFLLLVIAAVAIMACSSSRAPRRRTDPAADLVAQPRHPLRRRRLLRRRLRRHGEHDLPARLYPRRDGPQPDRRRLCARDQLGHVDRRFLGRRPDHAAQLVPRGDHGRRHFPGRRHLDADRARARARPLWAATGTGLVGIGMGLNQNTYTVAAQSVVDWSQRGTATAIISLMRMLGQTVGTAIYGAVVNLSLSRGCSATTPSTRIMDPDLRDKLPRARSRR